MFTIIRKQCLLVTSCNQAPRPLNWISVLFWLLTWCSTHWCLKSLIPLFSYATKQNKANKTHTYTYKLLDFSQLRYHSLCPCFKMLVFCNSAKIILPFIIADRDVLSLMHLGFFTYLTDFACFPDIHE